MRDVEAPRDLRQRLTRCVAETFAKRKKAALNNGGGQLEFQSFMS
jgi:hypothetical protein